MPRQDYHWIVKNSGHWFYRGTGLADGSVIRFAVGNEVDRRLSAYPGPTATEYVLLAQSPFTALNGSSGIHEATMYRAPSGAYVFGAGTLNWMRMIGGITGRNPPRSWRWRTSWPVSPQADRSVSGHRRAGSDRYGTAAQLSANTFAPRVPVAYVATGEDFPDALAAAAATGGTGPVLLVRRDEIPQPTRDELVRLQPQRIVLAGSSAVVSDAVLTQLRNVGPRGRLFAWAGRADTPPAVELSKD